MRRVHAWKLGKRTLHCSRRGNAPTRGMVPPELVNVSTLKQLAVWDNNLTSTVSQRPV